MPDHCWQLWNKESIKFKEFISEYSDRWISLPVSPSAEQYSLLFLFVIDKILNATEFNNGEDRVIVSSVKVHETDTGYAEAFRKDLNLVKYNLNDIILSKQVQEEFEDNEMFEKLKYYHRNIDVANKPFINPLIEQQV